MVRAWLAYADTLEETFQSKIEDDSVLGPEWATIGIGLRGLLIGNTGQLDEGILNAMFFDVLDDHGFGEDYYF